MSAAGADWQLIMYGGASHGFTHRHAQPGVTPGVAGNALASAQSSTSSGSGSGGVAAISAAARRMRSGSAASGFPSISAAAIARYGRKRSRGRSHLQFFGGEGGCLAQRSGHPHGRVRRLGHVTVQQLADPLDSVRSTHVLNVPQKRGTSAWEDVVVDSRGHLHSLRHRFLPVRSFLRCNNLNDSCVIFHINTIFETTDIRRKVTQISRKSVTANICHLPNCARDCAINGRASVELASV